MNYGDVISNIPHSGSTQLLASLFGGDIYHIFGGGDFHGPSETMLTLFGGLLAPFALWLYMALAVYFILAGLINKSQSGEFMLRSWNGFWPFLRMGAGTTAIVPAMAVKHLVAIQVAVLAVALFASSVADITWGKLLDLSAKYGLTAQHVLVPSIDTTKTDAYLNDAFKYSACVANKIQYDNTDPSLTLSSFDPIHPDLTSASFAVANACGGQSFLAFLKTAVTQSPPTLPDLTPQPGTDLISSDVMAKYNQYQSEQFNYLENQTAIDYIQNHVWPFYVNNMATFGQTSIPNALAVQWQGILTDFHQTLKDKIKSAILSDKGIAADVFTHQVRKYGWISAANYYKQLAQEQQIINSQITAGLENSPNYVDSNQQTDLTGANSMTKFHVERAKSWLGKIGDLIGSAASKVMTDPLGVDFLKMGSDTDPILAMTNFGQRLEGTAEILVIARHHPKLFSWIPVVGTRISKMINGAFMDFMLLIITVAGLVLGVILPNLPWIVFMFAIISWLIYVAEMFIAAPFWVVANALPEGGTVLSNVAKKGINNVVFILLFPTLSIAGLVASISISWMGMKLLNHYAYNSFKGEIGLTLPFDVVGHIIIYAVLAWIIITSSLGLIQGFPRTILNWISLSQPGLNPFDNKHDDAMDKVTAPVNLPGAVQKGGNELVEAEKAHAVAQREKVREQALRNSVSDDDGEGAGEGEGERS